MQPARLLFFAVFPRELLSPVYHVPQAFADLHHSRLLHFGDGPNEAAQCLRRRELLFSQDDDLRLIPLVQGFQEQRLPHGLRVVVLEKITRLLAQTPLPEKAHFTCLWMRLLQEPGFCPTNWQLTTV